MKLFITVLLTLLAAGNVALANDEGNTEQLDHGKKLHNNHCHKCHTDQVYTRDNRFVKTLNALGKQVRRCKDNTGAAWFDEDTDAVVNFLNTRYYKF